MNCKTKAEFPLGTPVFRLQFIVQRSSFLLPYLFILFQCTRSAGETEASRRSKMA